MATIDLIREVLNANLGIRADQVQEDSTFNSLNIDSLDMVELICELEDKCGVDFGEPEGLETVKDLIGYIESLNK